MMAHSYEEKPQYQQQQEIKKVVVPIQIGGRKPLDFAIFPRHTFQKEALSKEAAVGDKVECQVCLIEYENNKDTVVSLLCLHQFHEECIQDWLQKGRTLCPICKADQR